MLAAALLAAALLQLVDAATTLCILRLGGVELNPLLRWLMLRLGPEAALALKTALCLGLLGAAWGSGLLADAAWAAYALAALSAGAVINNLAVVARLRRRRR